MHKKQSGYYGRDWGCLVWGLVIFAALFAVGLWELLRWLWPFVKAAIHAGAA